MVRDGISTEDVKKTLAGLRDGSMEIGDNSISVHKESKVDDKTHNHRVLENSVVVNELNARDDKTNGAYVLLCVVEMHSIMQNI